MEGHSSESMMQQAQQVWSMLDDMADNDPQAYKKFIDKQVAEKKEFMTPAEPHMCVHTSMGKPDKVPFYINFCAWKRIPEPANLQEPVRVAGSAVAQIKDDKGSAAVTAVAFNQKVLEEYGKNAVNKTDQNTLVQIAMDFIEKQHTDIKINRNYKILAKAHKGSVKMIQESLFQAFQKKDKAFEENLSDVMKDFAPLATESPETLINHLHTKTDTSETLKQADGLSERLSGITLNTKPVKKGLIEEVSNSGSSLPEPVYELDTSQTKGSELTKSLLLKISLPGVRSVNECELDISKDDVSLHVEGKYELKLTLPRLIIDSEATAKFIKKSSTLTLIMPVDQL